MNYNYSLYRKETEHKQRRYARDQNLDFCPRQLKYLTDRIREQKNDKLRF